jgi:hypothetical protein
MVFANDEYVSVLSDAEFQFTSECSCKGVDYSDIISLSYTINPPRQRFNLMYLSYSVGDSDFSLSSIILKIVVEKLVSNPSSLRNIVCLSTACAIDSVLFASSGPIPV